MEKLKIEVPKSVHKELLRLSKLCYGWRIEELAAIMLEKGIERHIESMRFYVYKPFYETNKNKIERLIRALDGIVLSPLKVKIIDTDKKKP